MVAGRARRPLAAPPQAPARGTRQRDGRVAAERRPRVSDRCAAAEHPSQAQGQPSATRRSVDRDELGAVAAAEGRFALVAARAGGADLAQRAGQRRGGGSAGDPERQRQRDQLLAVERTELLACRRTERRQSRTGDARRRPPARRDRSRRPARARRADSSAGPRSYSRWQAGQTLARATARWASARAWPALDLAAAGPHVGPDVTRSSASASGPRRRTAIARRAASCPRCRKDDIKSPAPGAPADRLLERPAAWDSLPLLVLAGLVRRARICASTASGPPDRPPA